MPLVRLIIFLFRGIGRIFAAIGRFLKALVGAGMRSFLVKSFEVILRLGFVGSLAAVVAVCMNLFDNKHYMSNGNDVVGPPYKYRFETGDYYGSQYRTISLEFLLLGFMPKDAKVLYGSGKLDVEGVIEVWSNHEMVDNIGRWKGSWISEDNTRKSEGGRLVLKVEDFNPRSWDSFAYFFEHAWAIISLPILLVWLVFPAGSRIIDRIHRACLVAPLCAIVSCSFAYLLTRYWLSVQHAATAELVLDLPRWVHPVGILNKSIFAGAAISLIPIAVWYLLKWVLGPFLGASSAVQNP